MEPDTSVNQNKHCNCAQSDLNTESESSSPHGNDPHTEFRNTEFRNMMHFAERVAHLAGQSARLCLVHHQDSACKCLSSLKWIIWDMCTVHCGRPRPERHQDIPASLASPELMPWGDARDAQHGDMWEASEGLQDGLSMNRMQVLAELRTMPHPARRLQLLEMNRSMQGVDNYYGGHLK